MITSCKNCVFAEYDNNNLQTGCRFNDRLSIYKSRNKANLESGDGKRFYHISEICNACTRPNLNGMPPLDEVYRCVSEQIFIDNAFVLPMKEWNDSHIEHFIEVGLSQVGNPELIIVFSKSVPDDKVHSIPKPIKTIKLLDRSLTNSILNYSIKQPKTNYITLIKPGDKISPDLNDKINHIRNIDLIPFYMIYHEQTYHEMVIPHNLAKYKTLNEILDLRPNALKWTELNQK